MAKGDALHQVRRIAIDVLQAGNYIEAHKYDSAMANIRENIEHLGKLLAEMERLRK